MITQTSRAYLVGHQNLNWKAYFELWCDTVGYPQVLEVSSEEPLLLPNIMMFAGRSAIIYYQPEGAEKLGYGTRRVSEAITELVTHFRQSQ